MANDRLLEGFMSSGLEYESSPFGNVRDSGKEKNDRPSPSKGGERKKSRADSLKKTGGKVLTTVKISPQTADTLRAYQAWLQFSRGTRMTIGEIVEKLVSESAEISRMESGRERK